MTNTKLHYALSIRTWNGLRFKMRVFEVRHKKRMKLDTHNQRRKCRRMILVSKSI